MDVDQINDWIYQRQRESSWAAVVEGWSEGFRRTLELATAVPAASLEDTTRYPWLDGYSLGDVLRGTLEHHQEHYDELRPLLAA